MAAPRKDNVKQKILSSTEELIQVKQLNEISLAEIAKAAGISKGTLYYHYNSKDEILLDVTSAFLDEQLLDLIKWTQDKSKDTSIHRLVMYVVKRALLSTTIRMHLIYNAILGNEEVRLKLLERYAIFQNQIAQKIKERANAIDGDFAAWLILLICDGLNVQQQLKNSTFDIEKFTDELVNLAKRFE
ncbi:MAG: TetR/AcrR family transcriptional regulator [Clostridia bacterium]